MPDLRRVAGFALLAAACAATASARAPEPASVEPPSWWPGHSLDPVRLLIRGHSLHGARVEAANGDGVEVGLTRVNARGTALFVDLHIASGAAPGPRQLRIATAAGSAEASFELLAPLPRRGRFQGISTDDVIYLLMPDRFANGDRANDDPARSRGLHDRGRVRYYHGGDLRGVIDRLPYLADLGVTALWLNPVYDNVDHLNELETYDDGPITDYHGYGAVDFYAVDEHLGDLDTLRELADAAHERGIKVIQDQVANHTGPYHPWVDDPPTPTWFNGSRDSHLANTWQIWTLMDPRAGDALRRATLDGWFIDILPDLNQDDEEAARYLIQNSLWWVGMTGLDAIRQDTLPYVPRRFWRDWTAALAREYPRLDVIGELFDGDPALVSFFQGGATRFDGVDSGIRALFDFPVYFPLRRAFAQGQPLLELAKMLARDHLYPDPDGLVTFLGLHDVQRFMSEPGASAAGLKLAFAFLFTARGVPLIYYGDEIAMRGGSDPDNRRDFPGGWPDDPRSAFEPEGRTPEQQEVFAHVRRLAGLRRELEELRRGRMVTLLAEEQALVYARVGARGTSLAAFNNAPGPADLRVDVSAAALADGTRLRDGLAVVQDTVVSGSTLELRLPARAAAVLSASHADR